MTTHATNRRVQVSPVTSIIGAEIGGVDLREPLDAETVSEIADALVHWKVLFFRDQAISYDQQIAFARNFGDVTPAHPIDDPAEFANPNVVKVVCDAAGRALYFSRAPIPWWRDGYASGIDMLGRPAPLRHIGVYGYQAGFLKRARHSRGA